jgi:hypothetical protein
MFKFVRRYYILILGIEGVAVAMGNVESVIGGRGDVCFWGG